jgi:hypothetical protein
MWRLLTVSNCTTEYGKCIYSKQILLNGSAIKKKIYGLERIVIQNSIGKGRRYIDAKKEKVLEHHSGLRPSEKEFPEWCSSALHHKHPCSMVK